MPLSFCDASWLLPASAEAAELSALELEPEPEFEHAESANTLNANVLAYNIFLKLFIITDNPPYINIFILL